MESKLTELITSLRFELKKEFLVYDLQDRVIDIYQAHINASNGTPCLRTTYEYVGTSTRVEKMKETADVWSAAYDI